MVCEPSWGTCRRDILRPARGRCGLVRDKIRPADTKAPNLGCFALAGRFFSRARDKPAAPGEFCLAVTMHSGRPATVPPTRRPTDVRKTSDSQISHAIPPVQESTPAQKPQNINDQNQTPTCAHGNCMRNRWLTAIAGHQGDAPNHTSAH